MLHTQLVGNITADAETKTVESKTVIEFNVAVNQKKADKDTTTYIKCSKWTSSSKLADYLKKGKKVFVAGELFISPYLSQTDIAGVNTSMTVLAVQFLGDSKKEDLPK
ncbi:MAG: single-stranded DNA-binding protein [Anaerovoracaceae bacterium]